jgi:hypothetical protein
VLEVAGEALRYPWTECPGAAIPLRALRGMELSARLSAAAEHTDSRANCTHLFDLAALAVTHAHAGRARRQLDLAVPDWVEGRSRPSLSRDGAPLLLWDVERLRIAAPAPFAGVSLRGGAFARWAEANLDPETAEAALALRRACFIAGGRMHDLDAAADASLYMSMAPRSCHTFTPGIAERARRMRGTTLDFTKAPEALLADVAAAAFAKDGAPA